MTIIATSDEIASVPQIIEAFVPSIDLSELELIVSKFSSFSGDVKFDVNTKKGLVHVELQLK